MSWDWQFYCNDTATGEAVAGCFGPGGKEQTYLQWMLNAWGWTLSVSLLALLVALVVGSLIGIARTTPNKWLARFGEAWTELFRNIPLLVQVFLWYHVLPALFPVLRDAVPPSVLVVCALGFFTSARIGEQVKAGIQTLPRGQRYAGQALGMTLPQTYRFVLLPMAFRIVIPPLTSESMNIVKNSAVAFAVSIPELAQFAQQASEETSHFEEIFIPVTALYFISAFAINRVAKFIEARVRIPGSGGGK
ncbi:amino acid ABC transporter permease [Roseateles saccharophilus]|uniref:Amino acid ABC transporter membrane protein 1 (PAAT family) n=1 Tax=Roseateles saccharophilus TaxID=304 RepID=A0A4V2VSF0_ROSSA|nr:amino acid ABC transporter permease [Roseateles saccharophilus]MDG0834966.1 amino acid ABC transporter permease [Roseateles saccharophilus]TCV02140.1 amino acid ABC transporter membrane protein 1 (PAAT family) [Roseateles saccharophilus]